MRQNYLCGCGCGSALRFEVDGVMVLAPMIDEHMIPLGLLGSNDLSNRQLWAVACSAKKTAKRDIPAIAKAKRLERDADPLTRRKTKRPLKGRGFQKSLSRGFDGKVRARGDATRRGR